MVTNPSSPLETAIQLHGQNRFGEALAIYQKLLAEHAQDSQLFYLIGIAHFGSGNVPGALLWLQDAVTLSPDNFRAYDGLGQISSKIGNLPQSESAFKHAIALRHDFGSAHFHFGVNLWQQSKLSCAQDSFRKAVQANPGNADYCYNFGVCLAAAKNFSAAETAYRRSIQLEPKNADARNNLGLTLADLGRTAESIATLEEVCALQPDHVDALSNLAIARLNLRNVAAAVALSTRAIRIHREHYAAHNTLGCGLLRAGNYAGSELAFRRAQCIAPDNPENYNNLGMFFEAQNASESAVSMLRKAQLLNPSYFEAHLNEALILLRTEEWRAGWEKFELRWKGILAPARRFVEIPLWSSSRPLVGKTILVHAEQGLGDTIQFSRFVPRVANLGARVVFEVQPPLVGLLSHFRECATLVARGETIPPVDFQCPLMSLPWALGLTSARELAFDRPLRLRTRPAADSIWRGLEGTERSVGLVWQGNPEHFDDANRSIPMGQLVPLLSEHHHAVVSLQNRLGASERQVLKEFSVPCPVDGIEDMEQTASLVNRLKLVITVDTSIAHLAGALGVKTWLLLPFKPDWRWGLHRANTIWYSSLTLFRQPRPRDWESVLRLVADKLKGEPGIR